MVLCVQEIRHHHERQLGVLVGLGADEAVAVCHGDGLLEPILEPLQFMEIRDWVDAAAANGVVVPRDAPDHDDARVIGSHEGRHQFGGHEEVREEVDLHRLLVAIGRPLGVGEGRLVDARVADQAIDRLGHGELQHIVAELADGVERVHFTVHWREVVHVEAVHLRHGLHLVQISDCSNNMVLASAKECLGCLATEATGRSRQDDELLVAKTICNGFLIRIKGSMKDDV